MAGVIAAYPLHVACLKIVFDNLLSKMSASFCFQKISGASV